MQKLYQGKIEFANCSYFNTVTVFGQIVDRKMEQPLRDLCIHASETDREIHPVIRSEDILDNGTSAQHPDFNAMPVVACALHLNLCPVDLIPISSRDSVSKDARRYARGAPDDPARCIWMVTRRLFPSSCYSASSLIPFPDCRGCLGLRCCCYQEVPLGGDQKCWQLAHTNRQLPSLSRWEVHQRKRGRQVNSLRATIK